MEEKEILGSFLPKPIVAWFDIVRINENEQAERMDIYLDEKKTVPEEVKDKRVVSDGFTEESVVQDFPIRGRGVYLHLRRRKWVDKETGSIYSRKFDIKHKGTELTQEFAAFLKAANR